MRRRAVTAWNSFSFVWVVLSIDIVVLIVWSIVDPLTWQRTIITTDQYGTALESAGYCTSEHWTVFAGIIASVHVALLVIASVLCYVARDVPTSFSEGKVSPALVFH